MIDFGRKLIMWVGSIAMAVLLLLFGILVAIDKESNGMLKIALILIYRALFSFSMGPIPWLYNAETMTDKGVSTAAMICWLF